MKKIVAFVKKHQILFGILAATFIIMIPVVFFIVTFNSHITIEAGTKFQTENLWKTGIKPVVVMEDVVDTNVLGERVYKARVFGLSVGITVEVCDTKAPMAGVRNLVINYGSECKPEDFVISCIDATEVTYQFVNQPDCKKAGTQIVNIQITDVKNNSVIIPANLTVIGTLSSYTMELGADIPLASEFVLDDTITAEYVTEPETSLFEKLGSFEVEVLFNGNKEHVTIHVVDKTSPVVEVTNKTAWLNKALEAEEFVTSIEDASETTVSYKTQPDFSKEGTQKLVISIKDSAGNVTDKEVELTVNKDTTAPTISTSYIKVTVNGSLSYKKSISVSDNCDSASDITLDIDNSNVNLSAIGSYIVYCTATDTSGNVAKKDITVQVVDTATEVHTQEEINRYCDDLLARIIDDSMSTRDKAYAIYKWTRSNIGYINNSQKGDWLQGAYDGLIKKQGDCFTYAATAKALLERIGLQPLEIKKEKADWTTQSNHYWLLLDLGDGLYHYDPTPRKDGTWFFMWTDAQIKEYSDSHWGSHNFTRENYPKIN